MKYEKSGSRPISGFLFMKCVAFGLLLFWLVGVWLLPERSVALKYFRGWLIPPFLLTLFGRLMIDKFNPRFQIAGDIVFGLGLVALGAFFGFCSYLIFTAGK